VKLCKTVHEPPKPPPDNQGICDVLQRLVSHVDAAGLKASKGRPFAYDEPQVRVCGCLHRRRCFPRVSIGSCAGLGAVWLCTSCS